MKTTEQPKERLRLLARASIVAAKSDTDKALELLDTKIKAAKDVELERELTAAYRIIALRSLLATHYNELRAEGRIPRLVETPIPTTDFSRTRDTGSPSWAKSRIQDMQERGETRRRNYLNDFLVNGEPIGDLTPETVLVHADLRERDARFMRLLASGVPANSRIRDFVTSEEAEQRWKLASGQPPQPEIDARRYGIVTLLMKGRVLRDQEYQEASKRVADLRAITMPTSWDTLELDALARVIYEYEEAHRD